MTPRPPPAPRGTVNPLPAPGTRGRRAPVGGTPLGVLTFLVPGPPAMRDIPVSEEERPGCPPRASCCGDIASMKMICKPSPSPGQGSCAARSAQAGRRRAAGAGGSPPVGAMDRGPGAALAALAALCPGCRRSPRPPVSASPAPPLRARPAPAALPAPACARGRELSALGAAGATNLAGSLRSSRVPSLRGRAPRTAAFGCSSARLSARSLAPARVPSRAAAAREPQRPGLARRSCRDRLPSLAFAADCGGDPHPASPPEAWGLSWIKLEAPAVALPNLACNLECLLAKPGWVNSPAVAFTAAGQQAVSPLAGLHHGLPQAAENRHSEGESPIKRKTQAERRLKIGIAIEKATICGSVYLISAPRAQLPVSPNSDFFF